MDVSSTVATWLSLAVTILGLGSIATQFGTIIDQADPFHSLRDIRHLGSWWRRQPTVPWYRIIKPPPVGPVISADLSNGICGKKRVHLSRLPLTRSAGQAAWSILLAVVHPVSRKDSRCLKPLEGVSITGEKEGEHIVTITDEKFDLVPCETWADIPLRPLVKHRLTTCTVISRGTLLALFCLTNARQVYRYSSASGHRAAYASYCGQWRIEWPIGDRACVFFCAHDSHVSSKDVYPAIFEQRTDKCLQMLAGVIDSEVPNGFKCAFPGRKSTGTWRLEYAPKGFGGAHSGRHLYNMIGGKVNEVDYLFLKPRSMENESSKSTVVLRLPNKEDGTSDVILYIGHQESAVLDQALDNLPWSFLSWSIHRGLRDILTAYSKQRMDLYRNRLANTLRLAVLNRPETLIARGWDSQFVRHEMADMASSAVLSGQGNSGDAVRVVTEIAASLWDGDVSALDETHFWRQPVSEPDFSTLSPMAVIALVKCFVLEWSNDLDYQMYHDFPLELYLG
ncbi:hypothetical protein N7509_003920 [Penicillium cosmopolitanum]|uniref:Uncharacterized protein n=1 Tax=Penicillium cosmopolitanum TaxID=1131564 RepID=A0A9W9W5W2_9EURO|nr:uncharacterized protein N7509_003920 [Penicillium cosmopolitanum]KAJ5404049.1 hypothetical protein N7509_003920 [Penicillium cosmopolitanum]